VQHPLVLTLCWIASASLSHYQLTKIERLKEEARLFAIYQVPSAVLFSLGAYLITSGRSEWAVFPLLISFAARAAVLPLHGWFVRFVEKAPLGLVVAFASPQLGVYAHLEILQPHMTESLAHLTAGVGAVSAIFGAFLALGQTKARRAAAYLVMSQTGLVAFGLENSSPVGWSGAMLMWFVLSLGSSGFLLALSALAARRGELVIGQTSGQPEQVPRLASAMLLLGLATVGCPLTLGFVAEDLLVQGSIVEHPILALALIFVTALNGITIMRLYFGLFAAGPHRPGERDLGALETFVHTFVLGLLFLAGVFPGAIVTFIQ
jgi:NADH-quinone oxidoreductase subunit M